MLYLPLQYEKDKDQAKKKYKPDGDMDDCWACERKHQHFAIREGCAWPFVPEPGYEDEGMSSIVLSGLGCVD